MDTVSGFFNKLMDEKGHSLFSRYFQYLLFAIKEFLDFGTKERAFDVYRHFLDIYHVNPESGKMFLDIFDVLKNYEESAAGLTEHQRDHYSHSVYVFLLGICVYTNNQRFRDHFASQVADRCKPMSFDLINEEFLFCWGVAALFHDIGYPVEIASNQIKEYIKLVSNTRCSESDAKPYIDFLNFSALNSIQPINIGLVGKSAFESTDDLLKTINLLKPTDLLAYNIHRSFGEDLTKLRGTIDGFLDTMHYNGFVDHGFFSSIIVEKWYGEMLQQATDATTMLYNEISLASEAIFLHNFYAGTLMRPPYDYSPLKPSSNALAYLLILCDESQEWNREAYGGRDSKTLFIDTAHVEVSEDRFSIRYVTERGIFKDEFPDERKYALLRRLCVDDIFSAGMDFSAETLSGYYVEHDLGHLAVPRLLIDQLESLAIMIHEDYVAKQLERNPDQQPEFPTWESLPPSMKYSNIRQAAAISDKLKRINCYLGSDFQKGQVVTSFTDAEIEYLAEYEHGLWVKEREESGWKYNEVRDTRLKKSPYLVPYHELAEDIKELDRDTIRNIVPLVEAVGLKVFKAKQGSQTDEKVENDQE
jgi:hypothetical protein